MKKDLKNSSITGKKIEEITKDLLSKLKKRPSEIIARRFGLLDKGPMVLGKIGEEFNITRERVRQIEADCSRYCHIIHLVN